MTYFPLCEDRTNKAICFKTSIWLCAGKDNPGMVFGKFLCGEHHGSRKPCGRFCSHVLNQGTVSRYMLLCCGEPEDTKEEKMLARPIIRCNDCLHFYCVEHWIDHWHDTMSILS